MADLQAVLLSVRESLVELARRRETLQHQLAAVERDHARLSAAVSVIEEHAGAVSRPSSADPMAEPRLTDRILEALHSSARSRADLLRLFAGVNSNTLDSAVRRLVQRGLVQRQGRRFVPVAGSMSVSAGVGGSEVDQPRAESGAVPVVAGQVPVSVSAAVPVVEDVSGGMAAVPVPRRVDDVPLTVRVREAVATPVATTRAALVEHFAARGIKASAVDTAVAGLRRRGRLERRAGGVLVVPEDEVDPVSVGTTSQG